MDRLCPEGTHSSAIAMSMIAFPLILTSIIYRIGNTLNPPLLGPPGGRLGPKCLVLQCLTGKMPWKMAIFGLKCLVLPRFTAKWPGKWQIWPEMPCFDCFWSKMPWKCQFRPEMSCFALFSEQNALEMANFGLKCLVCIA